MTREEWLTCISETYGAPAEFPWLDKPTYAVFRHENNRKWFAVMMDIPRARLGLPGDEPLSIINVKCDPLLIGSFRAEPGFFPAYHMNKDHWLTAALDGSADEEKVRLVLDMSFALTAARPKKKKNLPKE